jgi:hypothetical protein
MKKYSSLLWLILVVILSLGAVRPLFSSGFFPMHDDVQVARVISMSRSLADGQFPVRWVADLGYGYGYPIFNFYGPLPYYVGGFINLASGDALLATKIMMGAGMLLAGVAMYAFASKLLPLWGAAALAMLYMYAPYHGLDLYVRGAVGELWAYGFLPLVVAGLLGNIPLGILGLFGVVTSHTIMGYLTVGLLVLYALVCWVRTKRFPGTTALMLGFGLGLSAFFWLPAAAEMKFTNVAGQIGGGAAIGDHFVCARQLWQSPWGYGGSAPGCADGLSFKLGKLLIILGAAGVYLLLRSRNSLKKPWGTVGALGAGMVAGSVFFMTPISQKIWEAIPYAGFIQYPWRLLVFATLGLVMLAAFVFRSLSGRLGLYVAALTFVLVALTNAEAFVPNYLYPATPADFTNESELRFRASRVSDEYMPPDFVRPQTAADIVRDTIPGTATSGILTLTLEEKVDVTIPRASFPGWQYWVDGNPAEARIVGGLPVFAMPAGAHTIEFRLTDTPVRRAGNGISLVSMVALAILYAKNKKAIT